MKPHVRKSYDRSLILLTVLLVALLLLVIGSLLVMVTTLALVASLAALPVLLIMGILVRLRHRAEADAATRAQQAVTVLLEEIRRLGEGDLVTELSVAEEATGTIAAALNEAARQLGERLARIQGGIDELSATVNESRATQLQLADTAEHQVSEISELSVTVDGMVSATREIAARTTEFGNVAAHSGVLAAKGIDGVQTGTRELGDLHDKIHDTCRRVGRLSDGSQKLAGLITEVSEVADQLNLLALNTALGASADGALERLPLSVADDVQEWAGRAAAAAYQASSLLKTGQVEGAGTIIAMEDAAVELAKGRQSIGDAASALGEIQEMTTQLARSIRDIAEVTERQGQAERQLSTALNMITGISGQVTAGTGRSTGLIDEMVEIITGLLRSMDTLRLPSIVVGDVVAADPSAEPRLEESLAALERHFNAEAMFAGTADRDAFDNPDSSGRVTGQ